MNQRTLAPLLACVALLAAPRLTARGDSVDLQLRGNDQVSGTIRPTFDREYFLCSLAQGTSISASVKGRSARGPAFVLALQQGGMDVPGAVFSPKSTGGALQPFVVAASGDYRVCVTGDGVKDGDYDLTVSWKPRTSWTASGAALANGAGASFGFSAPAGATATIDVVKAKGSAFAGSLVDVSGPAAFDADLTARGGPHAVVGGIVTSGDYVVNFTNVGGEGDWTAKVKLKLPKVRRGRVDIRDGKLRGAFGVNTVYGRVVGPAGGTVDLGGSTGGPLDGASATIPANALSGPVVVTISAAPTVSPGDGSHPAGPAVEFGPTGIVFDPTGHDAAKQARITIPFDPAFFPGGDTTNLVVYVRDAHGTVSQITGPFTIVGNTMSFSTSHFSAYQAGTMNARPFTGSFIALEVGGDLKSSFGGQFGFGMHQIYSDGAVATVFNDDARIEWYDQGAEGSFANFSPSGSPQQSMDVKVSGDATVFLTDNSGQVPDTITFVRGKSDDVLVLRHEAVVLLRRASGMPTRGSIAGTWNLFHLRFGADAQSGGQPPTVSLDIGGEAGGVVFTGDGKLIPVSLRGTDSSSGFPTGQWSTQVKNENGDEGITFDIAEDKVRVNPTGDPSFDLTPVLDGNVLVGRQIDPKSSNPEIGLFVFVRASSGVPKSAFAARYAITGNEFDVVDRTAPESQDEQFVVSDFFVTLAASGDLTIDGTQDFQSHDSKGAPTVTKDVTLSVPSPTRLTLRSDGTFTGPNGAFGALSPGGGFVVRTQFDAGRYEIDFGVPTIPTPSKSEAEGR